MRARRLLGISKYLILAASASIVFTWFRNDLLYIGGDIGHPLDPDLAISRLLNVWYYVDGGGATWGATFYYQYLLFYVVLKLGLGIAIAQRLFIYSFFAIAGISMAYLLAIFLPRKQHRTAAHLIGALSYQFSPAILRFQDNSIWFPYAVAPLIFALFVKLTRSNKLSDQIKLSILIAIASFGYVSYLPDYAPTLVMLFMLIIYSVGLLIFRTVSGRRLAMSWVLAVLFFVLVNLPILFEFYVSFSSPQALAETVTSVPISLEGAGPKHSFLLNLLIGMTVAKYYILGGSLLFANVVIVCVGILAMIRCRRIVVFMSLMYLFFVIVAAGYSRGSPFASLYLWTLRNFWVFRAFRTIHSFSAFPALPLSFLVGFGTLDVLDIIEDKLVSVDMITRHDLKLAVVITMVISIVLAGWPLFTGSHFNDPSPGGWRNNIGYALPEAYFEIRDVAENITDPGIIFYPTNPGYQYAPLQSTPELGRVLYVGAYLPPMIIRGKIIARNSKSGTGSAQQVLIAKIHEAQIKGDVTTAMLLAGFMNMGTVVEDGYSVGEDLWASSGAVEYDHESMIALIEQSGLTQSSRKLEKLRIFELRREVVWPFIYSSRKPVIVNNLTDIISEVSKGRRFNGIVFVDSSTWESISQKVHIPVVQDGSYYRRVSAHVGLFNGTGFVDIPNSLSLNPSHITVAAWVKINAISQDSQIIVGKWQDSPEQRQYVLLLTTGVPQFAISSNGQYIPYTIVLDSGHSLTYQTWNHVVATYDGSTVRIYVNGNLTASASWTQGLYTGTAPLQIGKYYDALEEHNFRGLIANVQIYNTSLKAPQIQSLFQRGILGAPITTKGLIGWWPLNRTSGTMVPDLSSNGNNGTASTGFLYQKVVLPLLVLSHTDNVWYDPDVSILEASHSRFVVHVNKTNPFLLILNTAFSPHWTAKIGNKALNDHFVANGYANGWLVNATGPMNLTIEFTPQNYYVISFTGPAVSLVLFSIISLNKRNLIKVWLSKVLCRFKRAILYFFIGTKSLKT